MKKRILFAGEFSGLSTGYGIYHKEVISRFFNNHLDKFDIAELAGYCNYNDPKTNQFPWRIYPVEPHPDDKQGRQIFDSDPINQFGKWKWEQVTLDFEPDICYDIRDFWYCNYQVFSPFRRLYNLCWCPTVDSMPCAEEWIDGFTKIDACFTYTEWAQELLKYQAGNKIKLCGLASPGVDTNTFFPIPNKPTLKQSLGLHPDTLIVGMVARNQIRKLFPHLFEAFARFLMDGPKNITCRTILYLHTAWPDMGWDIPLHLKEFGLGNKVMFTYVCRRPECSLAFSSFYQDARGICPKCGHCDTSMANSHSGIPNDALNHIYNLFDVYVQLHKAEGLGIPQIEAAAAGLPVLAINYAGSEDLIQRIGAIPLNVTSLDREVHTHRFMAIPDLNDFIEKLTKILILPSSVRQHYGFQSREKVKTEFSWDITVKNLVNVFEQLPKKNWKQPVKIIPTLNIELNKLDNATNEQFVNWCIINVLQRPELINSYFSSRIIKDLNWGHKPEGSALGFYFSEENNLVQKPRFSPFGRSEVIKEFQKINEFNNGWEKNRARKFNL